MKELSVKYEERSTNCDGPLENFHVRQCRVEEKDVASRKKHYLGHNHSEYVFGKRDIGRIIEIVTQPGGYVCWYFVNTTNDTNAPSASV